MLRRFRRSLLRRADGRRIEHENSAQDDGAVMAENWRRSVSETFRRAAGIRNAFLFRRALGAICVAATIALLSVGATGAERCPSGVCPQGQCAPVGASCCSDGVHFCALGSQCWATPSGSPFCCRDGDRGYADGGCAPAGHDYCGHGRYCQSTGDWCWTVYVSTGTCCPKLSQPEPDGYCAPLGTSPANYCGRGRYCEDANTHCCNDGTQCCK